MQEDNLKGLKKEKNLSFKQRHQLLKESGMFWEIYPALTGDWEKDKVEFTKEEKQLDKRRN